MTNETQKIQFCNSSAQYNCDEYGDEMGWVCEPEDVVLTEDTIEDFQNGLAKTSPDETVETQDGKFYIWHNRQSKAGARRGDLYMMDFGNTRAAYFTGE